jgi:WD40 repeat protein
VLAVAWSPDRPRGVGPRRQIDPPRDTTGAVRRVLKGHEDVVTSLAFSPDGRLLASAGLMAVMLWDLRSPIDRPESKALAGHAKWSCPSPSPGRKAAGLGSYDRTLRLWDVETGKELESSKGTGRRCGAWPSRPAASCWPPAAATGP